MFKDLRPNIWMIAIVGALFSGFIIWLLSSLLEPGSPELTIAVVAGIFMIAGGYIAILSSVASALVAPSPDPTVPADTHDKLIDKIKAS